MFILRSLRRRLELTQGPESWKQFLAHPDKHWKDGRSAKMLAEAWEASAPDVPSQIRESFKDTPFESFEPFLAIPEYEVKLPGGGAASQNDLFVLGRIADEVAVHARIDVFRLYSIAGRSPVEGHLPATSTVRRSTPSD